MQQLTGRTHVRKRVSHNVPGSWIQIMLIEIYNISKYARKDNLKGAMIYGN